MKITHSFHLIPIKMFFPPTPVFQDLTKISVVALFSKNIDSSWNNGTFDRPLALHGQIVSSICLYTTMLQKNTSLAK